MSDPRYSDVVNSLYNPKFSKIPTPKWTDRTKIVLTVDIICAHWKDLKLIARSPLLGLDSPINSSQQI